MGFDRFHILLSIRCSDCSCQTMYLQAMDKHMYSSRFAFNFHIVQIIQFKIWFNSIIQIKSILVKNRAREKHIGWKK